MKKLLALLLCLSLVLSLAACGSDPEPTTVPTTEPTTAPTTEPTEPPITVEQVYASVCDAMTAAEATRMHMELSYGVSYEEGEGDAAVTTEISYDMLIDMMVSEEPFGSYVTTSIGMESGETVFDITMDIYLVEEEGTVVTYMQVFDTWSRTDSGMTAEEYLNSDEMTEITTEEVWTGGEMPADMTLDEFTQDLDGTEVYILRGTLSVPALDDALTEMGVDLTEDVSEIAMPVVYYVDTQSYTIVRMEADMQPLMDILADSMSESILGDDAEATGLEMEVSTVIYDLGYGPQVITLPQEALDQEYEEEEPTVEPSAGLPVAGEASDLGDGSFVLPCGSEAVTITCPASWSGEVYDTNNVWIYTEDYSQYGDFYYLTNMTDEDFRDQIQLDIDDLEDLDIFISSGDGPVREGYTTMVVMAEGESYCYAWTPMGEGHLFMILADYTAEPDLEALMDAMLSQVAPYTGEFAVSEGAADLGDGSFSLPCGSEAFTITCPENWSGEVYDTYNIWLYNEDGSIYGDYFYLSGWTEDDILTSWIQPDVDTLKGENTFVSQGEGPICEGYTTQVVIGSAVSYYYAWAPAGDGCFLLQVYDWDGGDDAAELLPMLLSAVAPDTAE